jgi:hypothetical protein
MGKLNHIITVNIIINLDINLFAQNNELDENQMKFITLDKKLDEKREILSEKLKFLKNEYFLIIKSFPAVNNELSIHKEIIKNSLLSQIEVLIELINTTKLKINLMQQFESEYNS